MRRPPSSSSVLRPVNGQVSENGIDLLPILTGQASERPRTFFWRYRANAQAAMRAASPW
jgi:hypothetical protein